MEVYVLKLSDGRYFATDSYGYYSRVEKAFEAEMFENKADAEKILEKMAESKKLFLDTPKLFVKGTKASDYDYEIKNWKIIET